MSDRTRHHVAVRVRVLFMYMIHVVCMYLQLYDSTVWNVVGFDAVSDGKSVVVSIGHGLGDSLTAEMPLPFSPAIVID
jgi:hypothetical protein